MEDILLYEEVEEVPDQHIEQTEQRSDPVQDAVPVQVQEEEELEEEAILEEEEEEELKEVEEVEKEKEEEKEDVKRDIERNDNEILRDYSVSSDGVVDIYNNQAVIVSDNVIDKPLNEYNTSEGYQFLIFISMFIVGLIYVIRKGLPRWK